MSFREGFAQGCTLSIIAEVAFTRFTDTGLNSTQLVQGLTLSSTTISPHTPEKKQWTGYDRVVTDSDYYLATIEDMLRMQSIERIAERNEEQRRQDMDGIEGQKRKSLHQLFSMDTPPPPKLSQPRLSRGWKLRFLDNAVTSYLKIALGDDDPERAEVFDHQKMDQHFRTALNHHKRGLFVVEFPDGYCNPADIRMQLPFEIVTDQIANFVEEVQEEDFGGSVHQICIQTTPIAEPDTTRFLL